MTHSLILAIDQGGQSTRVAVFNAQGAQLCCFAASCGTTSSLQSDLGFEFIEQNPQEILSGLRMCLDKITHFLGDAVQDIIAAGFAGQGSSLLCWHSQTGEALTPVLSWQDIRGKDYLQGLQTTQSDIQTLTGLRLSPHYGASKMRWCLDNYADVLAAQQKNNLIIGPIVSYLFFHLLGTCVVDPGHAQRTLLWNLSRNQWDDKLLKLFKLSKANLPECKFHDSYFGSLLLQQHKIPFTASARDQGASLFALGSPDKNTVYINMGTGAFIQQMTEDFQAPEGLLISPLLLSKNPTRENLFALEATVNGAAAAMGYLEEQTKLTVDAEAIAQALLLNPIKNCYFLNAVGGLSAPYWRVDLSPEFSEKLLPLEKILAWIESVIFQIVVNVNLMQAPSRIIISGGLSNADGVCQKIADLVNVSVFRYDNRDATLQGIACMAAGIPFEWKTATPSDIFAPQPNASLQARFKQWQKAMKVWLAR